ncbi:hypothetical protein NT239_10980 [Chitinibacter sp. SCUT-21]|uniref:hypothetical protein n=1 Tax=Chitinibacter sp. SCUT-21 TaxID=2970891 RepID=UPI0035A67DA4
MSKSLEAQSIIPLHVSADASPEAIVYDEKEVHVHNKKASSILTALFGSKYVKSKKVKIANGKFFSQALLKIEGDLLGTTDNLIENFKSKIQRDLNHSSDICVAIIDRNPNEVDRLIAEHIAKKESGDIVQFMRARMDLKEPILVGFGDDPIPVDPLPRVNITLMYDDDEYAIGLIKNHSYSNFEIVLTTKNRCVITLKYLIEHEDAIFELAKLRQAVRVDFIKKTQTIGANTTRITGEFVKVTQLSELDLSERQSALSPMID